MSPDLSVRHNVEDDRESHLQQTPSSKLAMACLVENDLSDKVVKYGTNAGPKKYII